MANATNEKAKIAAVFGGAGFIGSHLCERLLEDGYKVICVDNFITSNQGNITHLLRLPNFKLLRHNINEPIDLEKAPDLQEFQLAVFGIRDVFNLAIPNSVSKFDSVRMETLLTNCLGMKNTLDIAVKYKSNYMYFSSHVVYGKFEKGDYVNEGYYEGVTNQLDVRACYDEGKRFAETMVDVYRQEYGLNTKIARVFRTYGPRMPLEDGHMIPDFILAALENKELVLHGDPTFRVSLIYVSDVVEACLRLMASRTSEPFNIGGPDLYTIEQVAQRIVKLTNSTSPVSFGDKLSHFREGAFPNISKIKEEIGWFPLVTLDDGLRKTIEYTQAHKDLLTFRSE